MKVAHQSAQRAVAHGKAVVIDNLARETGTLEKCAGCAVIDLRVDARRGALAVGGQHCLTERGQRSRARHGRQQKASGRKRLSQKNQRPGQVVDRVEFAQANDEIVRSALDGLCEVEGRGRGRLMQHVSDRCAAEPGNARALAFPAQEAQPLDDVFSHRLEQPTRGIGTSLEAEGAFEAGAATVFVEDMGDGVHPGAVPADSARGKR